MPPIPHPTTSIGARSATTTPELLSPTSEDRRSRSSSNNNNKSALPESSEGSLSVSGYVSPGAPSDPKKRTRGSLRGAGNESDVVGVVQSNSKDAKNNGKKQKFKSGTDAVTKHEGYGVCEGEEDDNNDWICSVCYLSEAFDGSDLMLCDGPCLRSFHIGCLGQSKSLVIIIYWTSSLSTTTTTTTISNCFHHYL
jgi:hypothetical protein